ncbi:MAG: pilin [Nitrosomonas sp.]|nr:pilin [Nitrosomonas sp.]
MIVVAIIGILAAVAVPAYQQYTLKARFSEVINATSGVKAGIEICVQQGDCFTNNAISNVAFGFNGVIPPQPIASGVLASVGVSAAGVITATAANASGLAGENIYTESSC